MLRARGIAVRLLLLVALPLTAFGSWDLLVELLSSSGGGRTSLEHLRRFSDHGLPEPESLKPCGIRRSADGRIGFCIICSDKLCSGVPVRAAVFALDPDVGFAKAWLGLSAFRKVQPGLGIPGVLVSRWGQFSASACRSNPDVVCIHEGGVAL